MRTTGLRRLADRFSRRCGSSETRNRSPTRRRWAPASLPRGSVPPTSRVSVPAADCPKGAPRCTAWHSSRSPPGTPRRTPRRCSCDEAGLQTAPRAEIAPRPSHPSANKREALSTPRGGQATPAPLRRRSPSRRDLPREESGSRPADQEFAQRANLDVPTRQPPPPPSSPALETRPRSRPPDRGVE